ncbi:alpha/beta fold hydrolase [uncultured Aquimarina sp.]|uniref:thioesterase II family protein n=1 Tax=uncultured Aquimarina sp. TaxID=575652 RepID=UPI002617437F|nr:alpha/beta fold hydrolase [uncultured Aquimarina sp.]
MYTNNKTQIFLLHFAGGSCHSYDFLRKYFNNDYEFHALELPGRGKRSNEKFLLTKENAIDDYFNQIKRIRNRQEPYLIYGHSMGATLGLSVTKRMEEIGDEPQKLIVTGNPGPGVVRRERKHYLLNDVEFKNELRKLGGVPEEVLGNDELFDYFSPIMRADFEVLEKDNFLEEGMVLNTPIYAIMGEKEETVDKIKNWNRFTKDEFKFKIFSGNHFFINDYPKDIANIIVSQSRRLVFG